MRSTPNSRDHLLRVAVEQFALEGFEKTSVRSVARAAGVSPGLVIHHFQSKDMLVNEAIITTLGQWIGVEKNSLIKQEEARLSDWVKLVRENQIKLQFLRQVLLANNAYTQSLFEFALMETKELIREATTMGLMSQVDDVDALATLLTSQALANIIFLPQLEKNLGGAITDERVASRLQSAQLQLMPLRLSKGKKVRS